MSMQLTFIHMIEPFLLIAAEKLNIAELPTIKLVKSLSIKNQPSFACYSTGNQQVTLAINNRHPIDVLRSLAHELVHHKQNINDELTDDSGDTGSYHENEANSIAGIIMRDLNKLHPEFLLANPISLP